MHDRSPSVIEVFEYPESGKTLPNLWGELKEMGAASSSSTSTLTSRDHDRAQAAMLVGADELKRSFADGREQGIREGRELEEETQRARQLELEKMRIAQAAELTNQLAQERDRFLESVEQQVVSLAVGIAERVLRREAQTDPLFLLGAVRVALGQLAENMHVLIRVPAAEAELWIETLSHIPNLKTRPEVVPDQAMHLGECMVESEMGSADLSLSSQLQSIQNALLGDAPASQRAGRDERKLYSHEVRS